MLSNRVVLVALLGATLGTAACNGNETSPFEPAGQPAYSEFSANLSGSDGHDGGDWGDTKPSSCKPLSLETESADIGPWGGVLRIGPHTLLVPPGALLQRTRITGRIFADSVNSIQFFPEGLRFLAPAVLQLSYENCRKLDLATMKVVYTSDDLLRLLELVPSEDRKLRKTVVGLIGHFSRYAVAY